jgi:hypothetical protein
MILNNFSHRTAIALGVLGFVFSEAAFAQKDIIYPSSATATVNSVARSLTSPSFSTGNDGSLSIAPSIYPADAIVVASNWNIQDRRLGPGADTDYGTSGFTATFSASTTAKPAGASNVTVAAISNCTLSSSASTCARNIGITAPTTLGSYQVKISVGGLGGDNGLASKDLYINFTVVEAQSVKIDTQLTVDKQCVLLNSGDVDLTAKLQKATGPYDPISGKSIDFFVEPGPIVDDFSPSDPKEGSALTGVDGIAHFSFNGNSLGVGDYNLYAEFAGDSEYNGSNDSDVLGITYNYLGFQPPINPEGNSIFGGRVIPIKIKLYDGAGQPVTNAQPTVWVAPYNSSNETIGTELEATSVSSADSGNIMRYDSTEQQYIYNFDATGLPNGVYGVIVHLGDSQACRSENPFAIITIQRKGKK